MEIEQFKDGEDTDKLLDLYDDIAEQLITVAVSDGHFTLEDDYKWPRGKVLNDVELLKRSELISAIHDGIPDRRTKRLTQARNLFEKTRLPYHEANHIFLSLKNMFLERNKEQHQNFMLLYQDVYLRALGRDDPLELDEVEKALVDLRISRIPLSHAQSVAEKINNTTDEQAYPSDIYRITINNNTRETSLRSHMEYIAESVVDFLAAGELLAIRYNTFSNFIWLGISVWKAITDVERAANSIEKHQNITLSYIHEELLTGKSLLLKFVKAHLEDPAQLKPRDYWYGQEYSYLTRDLIDLARKIVDEINSIKPNEVSLPPLLNDKITGSFLEYSHVGKTATPSTWVKRKRLLQWVSLFRSTGKKNLKLLAQGLDEKTRLQKAWRQYYELAYRSLKIFNISVEITIDPLFQQIARQLNLGSGDHKILFLPTHQSLFDHFVLPYVLNHKNLLQAIGWNQPQPCTILARSTLTDVGRKKIFGRTFNPIGFSPEEVDQIMEEVHGHVVMSRSSDTQNPTKKFLKLLEKRPGVIFPSGTTSAYSLQCLPMQHGLFSLLRSDLILIPLAFRGIHSLWPKCPKGNKNINSGTVEVVVSPPILGASTLLPPKRALRTQIEPATLLQAIQIADLYDPGSREKC